MRAAYTDCTTNLLSSEDGHKPAPRRIHAITSGNKALTHLKEEPVYRMGLYNMHKSNSYASYNLAVSFSVENSYSVDKKRYGEESNAGTSHSSR